MVSALKVDPANCKISKISVEAGPRGVLDIVRGRIKRRFVFPNGDELYSEVEPSVSAEFTVGGSNSIKGIAIIVGRGGASPKYEIDSVRQLFKFAT
jgi:hypothetical protein